MKIYNIHINSVKNANSEQSKIANQLFIGQAIDMGYLI